MAISITQTTFVTTQQSGLATKDVYGSKVSNKTPVNGGKQVINGVTMPNSIMSKINLSTSATNKRFDKLIADLTKVAEDSNGDYRKLIDGAKKVAGNKALLRKEFQGALLTDVLTNLGYGDKAVKVAGQIIGEKDYRKLMGTIGQLEPDAGIVINGITTILDAKNLDTATGITEVLTKLTGDSKLAQVLDLKEEAALLKGTLQKATALRIPELFDAIVDKVKDRKAKKRLMIQSVPSAASNSDIVSVRKVMDEITPEAVYTTYPDSTRWLVTNYKTLEGKDPTKEDETQLLTTLSDLNSEWWLIDRNGEKVVNYALFLNISEHSRQIFIKHNVLKFPATLAKKYKQNDYKQLSAKFRPWIKLPA